MSCECGCLDIKVVLEDETINIPLEFGEPVEYVVAPDIYTGPVTVTPSESEQTLLTADKMLTDNISVNPIPSEYIIPTGSMSITENGQYDITEKASVNVDVPAPAYKVERGSFTGNGGLVVSIPCDLDPDIIYIFSPNRLDDYTVESGGVTWAMLVTDLVCFTIRKTPTGTGTSGFRMPVTNNRPGKVYDNGTLTVYLPGSSIHKLADGETYNYVLVKLP